MSVLSTTTVKKQLMKEERTRESCRMKMEKKQSPKKAEKFL